jgi:hypothetical protein
MKGAKYSDARRAFDTLKQEKKAASVNMASGKWPDFGIALTKACRIHNITPALKPLGPCRPEEFPPIIQTFINEELLPRLTEQEREKLDAAKGMWPEYPELLKKLADDRNLEIPLMRLPGARELADRIRGVPALPDE